MEVQVLTVEIAKLELGPDDTLIVRVSGKPEMARLREFQDHVYKVLGHHRFMIVDANMVEFSIAKAPADHVQD